MFFCLRANQNCHTRNADGTTNSKSQTILIMISVNVENPEKVLVGPLVLGPAFSEACIEESIEEIDAKRKPKAVVTLRRYGPVDQCGGS